MPMQSIIPSWVGSLLELFMTNVVNEPWEFLLLVLVMGLNTTKVLHTLLGIQLKLESSQHLTTNLRTPLIV